MTEKIRLGLKENWKQFTILVLVNSFVGGMVGLERSILPEIAESEFNIAAKTAILSFIIVFGIVKAITNYFTGYFANRTGRKNLLVIGWLAGLPVPFILMFAGNWNWIIAANILLGINQGLCWSTTVIMKIDLVGEKERGFAMGINEFAGYISVGLVAFFTGWIAGNYGLRPYPFIIGIGLCILGLVSSFFFVKDTAKHVIKEALQNGSPKMKNIFLETTFLNRNLGAVTQAGLVNNLNDGMIWGLLPLFLSGKNFSISEIGIITAVYPVVWGVGQLFTGKMSDFFCKKSLLFWGMLIQGMALMFLPFSSTLFLYFFLLILLGWGTAMVYPTFLATISENTHPSDRAESLGIFRLWRDLGYAIGAILTGIIADLYGINISILSIGLLTIASSIFLQVRMRCQNKGIKLSEWLIKISFTGSNA